MKDLLMQVLLGQVRTGVAALGAYLGTYGLTVSGEMQTQLVGAAMVIVALVLSGLDKWWAKGKKDTAEVTAAVASAQATMEAGRATPVRVVVTPANLPNEAIKISTDEIRAAPPPPPVSVPPTPAPAA